MGSVVSLSQALLYRIRGQWHQYNGFTISKKHFFLLKPRFFRHRMCLNSTAHMDFYGQKVGYVRSRTTERIVTWDLICVCGEFPFFHPFSAPRKAPRPVYRQLGQNHTKFKKKSKNVFPEISSFFCRDFWCPWFFVILFGFLFDFLAFLLRWVTTVSSIHAGVCTASRPEKGPLRGFANQHSCQISGQTEQNSSRYNTLLLNS